MKTINLKKYYYPLYETDTFIELPDEIADAIVEEWRADHNSEQRLWSHTYSMDYSPGLEYHLLYHALSAEDTLLEEETRREQEEAHELKSTGRLPPTTSCSRKSRPALPASTTGLRPRRKSRRASSPA